MFRIINSKMSRNMCKWRHKVRNGTILPHWSTHFQNNFFLSNFTDNLSHFFTNLRPHNQNSFFLQISFCFLFQAPGYLETCVNGVTNCKTSKRALVPLLPGEMKLDLPDSKTFEEPFFLRFDIFEDVSLYKIRF